MAGAALNTQRHLVIMMEDFFTRIGHHPVVGAMPTDGVVNVQSEEIILKKHTLDKWR